MARASVIERSIEIAAPVDEVFAFHLDTRNAARIAPPEARILGVEGTFPLTRDAVVTMRMRPGPLAPAQTWRVRVAVLDPPRLLVDVAEEGPFPEWRHEHRFTPLGPSSTLLTDHVTYRLPLGLLGVAGDRVLVRHLLARNFRIRQKRTRDILEGREPR